MRSNCRIENTLTSDTFGPNPPKASRLDIALVARGLVGSRARARDLIARGLVAVDGIPAVKPAMAVGPANEIALTTDANRYVSRSALKLLAALSQFGFSAESIAALDIGASTGGFTQVLIEHGAARVFAVDVGHGQLDAALREDPRVVVLERTDARALTPERLNAATIGAVVADVSFISLTKVLPIPLALAALDAWLVALIKPQFEAGRAAVGKGGIVRDRAARQQAVDHVRDWVVAQPGWTLSGIIPSPITGGSGNEEFLIGARKHA